MKRKEFKRSQFEEHERWEEKEARRKADFHGDAELIQRANTGGHILQDIRRKNLSRIQDNGIGYSKESDKRTK